MFYTYVLQSIDRPSELYVGSTNDLKRRLPEHNSGKVFSTKRYMPWKLVYYEAYEEEKFARLREKRLKHNGNAMRELKKRIGKGSSRTTSQAKPLNNSVIDKSQKLNVRKSLLKSGAGFTLIEVLVTMGIFGVLLSLGLWFGIDFYKVYAFNSERQLVVGLLQKARSQSLANINQQPHGVRIDSNSYTIFEGNTYASNPSTHQIYEKHPGINNTGIDVIFGQLSGRPDSAKSFNLQQDSKVSAITINSEGQINW
jgi:prepilin-type N-terminal cleavage/methylation domain-containing protein